MPTPRRSRGQGSTVGQRDAVHVQGLAELQRELRALDQALPRELRQLNKAAAEVVAADARARARALGGIAAKAAPSVKAAAEQRRAKVTIGDARHPFALGAEFGAKHDLPRRITTKDGRSWVQRGWNQFRPWRGNQHVDVGTAGPGYFLYPAIRGTTDETLDLYERGLDALMRRAFPD